MTNRGKYFSNVVTPLEIYSIDDYLYVWGSERKSIAPIDAIRTHLSKYSSTQSINTGDYRISDAQKAKVIAWWEKVLRTSNLPGDLYDFEIKALTKWFGPQGGNPSKDQIMNGVVRYYENTGLPTDYPALSYRASIMLQRLLYRKGEFKRFSPRELYMRYKGDKRSNSGMTGWGDRRLPSIRKEAISQAYKFKGFDPAVLGSRYQRQKVRNIFMDSFANYYRAVAAYGPLIEDYKNVEWANWRGDRYIEYTISTFIDSHPEGVVFFESDYEAMDTWVTYEHAQYVLSHLKEWNIISTDEYNDMSHVAYEYFHLPLVTPDGVVVAKHNLFSGVYITNFIETLLNLFIMIAWITLKFPHAEYARDFKIVILGDDVLLVFTKLLLTDVQMEDLPDDFALWVWNTYHIKAEPLKQRISTVSGYFCKRRHAIKAPKYVDSSISQKQIRKSVYPITLAINSILYPEEMVDESKAQTLIRIWQILDNCVGHPLYKLVVRYIASIYKEVLPLTVTISDIEQFNDNKKSWRIQLFGETFSIDRSQTAQLWMTL